MSLSSLHDDRLQAVRELRGRKCSIGEIQGLQFRRRSEAFGKRVEFRGVVRLLRVLDCKCRALYDAPGGLLLGPVEKSRRDEPDLKVHGPVE